jgi:hypothetical protein
MSDDVINVRGEDVVVREDTAKAYRGVNWAWLSIAGFVVIAFILLFVFFFSTATHSPAPSQPAQSDAQRAQP